MAKRLFTDAAGREAYVDENGMVFTEGGNNPTYYTLDDWNARQAKKYGSSGENKSTSFVDELLNSINKQVKEETKFLDSYVKNNPFAFDEALARESATAEYDPYYTELLQDYTDNVELKRQSIQDDRQLQTELKTLDDASNSRAYARAVSNAEQGFAGSGLFFSGLKKRALGEQSVEYTDNTQRGNLRYEAGQRGLDRMETGLNTDLERRQRDLEREKQTAIEGGILQRESEAITQYNTPLVQSYQRRFGGGSNVLDGYLVPSYLKY